MRTARSLPYRQSFSGEGVSLTDTPPSWQRPPWQTPPLTETPPLDRDQDPPPVDKHLWKHNHRKLRLRAVTMYLKVLMSKYLFSRNVCDFDQRYFKNSTFQIFLIY